VQKIWKILLVFVIFALALPTGIFASVKNAQNSGAQTPAKAVQLVRVVSLKVGQTVASQSSVALKTEGCSLNAPAPANSLQNAESVGLNQPASCFGLALAKPVTQPKLTVAIIRQLATVIVPSSNRILGYPSFVPTPAARDSALPSLVFAAFGIILFEEKKIIQKLATRLLKNIAQSLTLHQLGVLRC
jgi:hypothetical protein